MNNEYNNLTDQEVRKFNVTSGNQTLKAIIWDTMNRNGGTTNANMVRKEYNRRVVANFNGTLWNPCTENQLAEVWAVLGPNTYHWLDTDASGTWTFANDGDIHIESYFESNPRYWGFDDVHEFLKILDRFTPAYNEGLSDLDVDTHFSDFSQKSRDRFKGYLAEMNKEEEEVELTPFEKNLIEIKKIYAELTNR